MGKGCGMGIFLTFGENLSPLNARAHATTSQRARTHHDRARARDKRTKLGNMRIMYGNLF